MELVYHLLYAIGLTHEGSLVEIQPILLDYEAAGSGGHQFPHNSRLANATPPSNQTSTMCRQIAWTAQSLLRCRFTSEQQARDFIQAFNQAVSAVFDTSSMCIPFAHADQTWPERQLRQHLNVMCREENRRNVGFAALERYFHNGTRAFRVLGNSRVEPVAMENLPKQIYHLHAVVCSLRKYAQVYEEKRYACAECNLYMSMTCHDCSIYRFNAIIQNLPSSQSQTCISSNEDELTAKAIDLVLRSEQFKEQFGRSGSQDSFTSVSDAPSYRVQRLQRRRIAVPSSPPLLVRVQFATVKEAYAFIRLFRAVHQVELEASESKESIMRKAFAQSDLTPPELALSYALKDYCREKNSQAAGRFYTRYGKVYEKRMTR